MLEIIAIGLVAILCGAVVIRVLSVIRNAISDLRYRKIRTDYIRSITVDEWLELDIVSLCSKSGESGCITVGHRISTETGVYIYKSPSFDYHYALHYLRAESPTRMVRCDSLKNYFINYKIEGIPNLVDALRMLKL